MQLSRQLYIRKKAITNDKSNHQIKRNGVSKVTKEVSIDYPQLWEKQSVVGS